jgi:hypothetical protein
MRRVALGLLLTCAHAYAGNWAVTGEGGAELDTNVQRVETGPGLDTAAVSSPVLRLGARAEDHDRVAGGGFALGLSDLTRIVANNDVSVENVTQLAGDLRWLHPLGDRPVSAGAGITAIDALGLSDPIGARTFRVLGADALLAMHSGDDHRLTLAAGARSFHYKPDPLYDYDAPAFNARLDSVLWHADAHTRSLELATTLGFEAREYDGTAFADGCPPGSTPDPMCFTATELTRRDRYARAGVELTYVGHSVVTVGYQLTVIDSNSFGQSLVRHRGLFSGTVSFGKVYTTLLAILQIDQYTDGLILQRDLQHAEFTNIEDENRSTIQLHVARKVSDAWGLEGRAAIWKNIGVSSMELSFGRELLYAGLVYSR